MYTKPGVVRPVIIPEWSEVPVFIIKNNLRTAGISREKYLEEIFRGIEVKYLFEDFYKIFLRCVRYSGDLFCGSSEYELYFNYNNGEKVYSKKVGVELFKDYNQKEGLVTEPKEDQKTSIIEMFNFLDGLYGEK